MRIGIQSAQLGRLADPAAVRSVAEAAEQLGYSSLWVVDRLPVAVEPAEGYGGMEGMPIPAEQRRTLDPLAVLAAAAALTHRVRLGTSVLVGPWYPPALLARSLTTLDVLSQGRLEVGLGIGWSRHERRSLGLPEEGLGARLDALLDVLDAHWGDGPVAYDGPAGTMAPSHRDLAPVQVPRPPVLLAAYSPAGLDRVARRADGWNPAGLPVDAVALMWAQVKDLAVRHGRDPEHLRLVVRANVELADAPLGVDRPTYHGTVEQVAADLDATRRVGAHEVILSVGGDVGVDQALDGCARLAERLDVGP